MSEIPPIGIPNLVSQSALVARTSVAMAGAERAANARGRAGAAAAGRGARRAGAADGATGRDEARSGASSSGEDPHSRYDHGDELDDDEGEDEHVLDVTA